MSQTMWLPSLELMMIAGRAISLVVAFAVLAWAFAQWRRASIRDTERVFEQLDLVRADLLIMKEAMNHATHRVERVASEPRMPAAPASGAARGYEIAARMARNGAPKDELIRSCGITNHEADLLIKLHRREPQSNVEPIGREAGRQVRQPLNQSVRQDAPMEAPRAAATTSASQPRPPGMVEMPGTQEQFRARPRMQTSRLVAVG